MTVCELNKNRIDFCDFGYGSYVKVNKNKRKKRKKGISGFGAMLDIATTTAISCSIAGSCQEPSSAERGSDGSCHRRILAAPCLSSLVLY